MFRSAIKLFNSSLLNRLNHLTAIRSYAPRRRRPNLEETEPGINKRLQFFKEDFIQHDDPEVIDSMEPNFMNLSETHKQHEKEMRKMKDKVQTMIVGRKYFKTKSPNFLTYNEKEQIRSLHDEDPDEWTADKLSESFPADPYTISLVIRSKWIPKDTNRIFKHDESVKRNWREFNEGKLEVEPILAKHLKKFAFRDVNEMAKPPQNKRLGVEFPKPKSNEFLSIVMSCKKYRENSDDQNSGKVKQIESTELRVPKQKPLDDENTFMMEGQKRFGNKSITLSELQKKNPDINLQVRVNEMAAVDLPKVDLRIRENENNFISLTKDDEKILESLKIQERIKIPKKLWQKGKIYKVSDCFYADDGEFLYRVPGLE